jgi:hypothetical protein
MQTFGDSVIYCKNSDGGGDGNNWATDIDEIEW